MTAKIMLTREEIGIAKWVVLQRIAEDQKAGLKDKKVVARADSFEGFCAELAVARHLNLYPDFNTDPRFIRPADLILVLDGLALALDVKWTRNRYVSIRREGRMVDIYLGVRGSSPSFEIMGWLWSQEAKTDEFWNDKAPVPCWIVPFEKLHPIETLRKV